MKVSIIAVGKVKEKFINEGIKEFQKRLSGYIALEIIEVPDENLPKGHNIEDALEKEGKNILKHISEQSYVIILDIAGEQLTSQEMAERLQQLTINGNSHFIFVIGGSNGLHELVKKSGNQILSFSKFTFPHQLFRLILLEQIYRWVKIIKNEPYHK